MSRPLSIFLSSLVIFGVIQLDCQVLAQHPKELTNSTFGASQAAAVFQFSGNYYLAVNDGNQGFQAATDSIIQLGSTSNPNINPDLVQVF